MGLMTQPGLVHANSLTPPDLFWRTATAIVMSVATLVGVALAVGPLVLLAVYRNVWLLLLLTLVPAGAWIAVKILGNWRKLRRHYAHLPDFTLFQDRIDSVEWRNPLGKGVDIAADEAPRRRTIPLDSVTSVVASFALIRQTRTRLGNPITETAPVLYVRYNNDDDGGGSQELLSVPFSSHKDKGVDRWLSHFAALGVPLRYTARILFRHDTQILTDADRLEHLNTAPDIIPYTFDEGWRPDEQDLGARWLAVQEKLRTEEEEHDPELKEKRSRHSFRTWISMALVFVWLMITAVLQQLAAQGGHIDPANPLISFLCVVAFGFAFFYLLRSYLRWPYMFIYSGGTLITGLAYLIVSRPGTEQEVGTSFFLAALAFQPLCWLPYLVVKKVAAQLKARDEAQRGAKLPA